MIWYTHKNIHNHTFVAKAKSINPIQFNRKYDRFEQKLNDDKSLYLKPFYHFILWIGWDGCALFVFRCLIIYEIMINNNWTKQSLLLWLWYYRNATSLNVLCSDRNNQNIDLRHIASHHTHSGISIFSFSVNVSTSCFCWRLWFWNIAKRWGTQLNRKQGKTHNVS